jgi:ribosome-associated toxin RatA of RatAB toxin-antitoxin module
VLIPFFRLLSRQSLHQRLVSRLFVGLSLVGVLLSLVSSTAFADSVEWQTLKQGKVVVKQYTAPNTVPSVEAKILIPKPPEKVWTVVSDPETLLQAERKVKRVKVLSRTANKQNVSFSVIMTSLFPAFNYILLQELSPPYLINFHRVSGSFKDIQGAWRLIPADNGTKTILSYTLKLDPGPLVPRSLLLAAVKSDLPNFMNNAKTSINKNTP